MKKDTKEKIALSSLCLFIGIGIGKIQKQDYAPIRNEIKSAYSMRDPNDPNQHYLSTISDLGQENILTSENGVRYQNIDDISEERHTKLKREIKEKIIQDMIDNYGN